MFCPKCGTKNPENGKFCRSCGTDLSPVSNALSGRYNKELQGFEALREIKTWNKKDKPLHWEGAVTKLFSGIAFLVVSIVLSFSLMGTGWWFWMLIPAFSMIGAGIAQIIQLRKNEKMMNLNAPQERLNTLQAEMRAELQSPITDYTAPNESRYKTGDLVPPSVVEGTTRHLQMDSEGKTMTLPKTGGNQN